MKSTTYDTEDAWKTIQTFLPEKNQLNESNSPYEEFYSFSRFNIHIDEYKQEKTKGVIVIFHGVGGNGRLLEFIALPLWKAGYEVICPDLPLYGLTEYKGKVTYSDWISCGLAVCNKFEKNNLPLFVFGLSAGGMLAYQVACKLQKINGILVTCILDQRIKKVTNDTASSKIMSVIGKPFLKLTHKFFGRIKLPMKFVCNMKAIVNNKELADFMMKDKLSSGAKVSMEFLYGMLYPDIAIEAQDFKKCPVLLVHPGKDNWTAPELSKLFFDKIQADKDFVLLPGAGHFPIEAEGLAAMERKCIEFLETNSASWR